jgi:transcriptional regulator with XRE-family HTH domain
MARRFTELEARMSPTARRRAEVKTHRMLAGLLLPELRRRTGKTQAELARALGIKQPTLSRIESQDDMQVSTLTRIVEALGGSLDIVVHLPSGDYRLTQFDPTTSVAEPPAAYDIGSTKEGAKGDRI